LSVKGDEGPNFDHKPTNDGQYLYIYQFMPVLYFAAERARISKAGGYVENYRVNGMWIAKHVLFRHDIFVRKSRHVTRTGRLSIQAKFFFVTGGTNNDG